MAAPWLVVARGSHATGRAIRGYLGIRLQAFIYKYFLCICSFFVFIASFFLFLRGEGKGCVWGEALEFSELLFILQVLTVGKTTLKSICY